MILNRPPLVVYLFLEEPLVLILTLSIPSVFVLIWSLRRGYRRPFALSMVGLVIALCIYVLSWMVVTDREQLLMQTTTLVQATMPLDMTRIDQMVSQDVEIGFGDGRQLMDRYQMQLILKNNQVSKHRVIAVDAEVVDMVSGISAIELRTTFTRETGTMVHSAWKLLWQRDSGGQWQVVQIICLQLPPQL